MKISINIGTKLCSLARLGASLLLVVVVVGCASTHQAGQTTLERGRVVESEQGSVAIVVGDSADLRVGQELDIVHLVRHNTPGQRRLMYDRVKTGAVRIEELESGSLIRAVVVSGTVRKGYFVELAERHEIDPRTARG